MSRRTLSEKLAAFLLALLPGLSDAAEVPVRGFEESPSCRVNEIPLGRPARIDARQDGAKLVVEVAANFGCGTTAGKARAELEGEVIRLYADTILPDHPSPACKCTRHLRYRLDAGSAAVRRVVFVKDGREEGEGTLDP